MKFKLLLIVFALLELVAFSDSKDMCSRKYSEEELESYLHSHINLLRRYNPFFEPDCKYKISQTRCDIVIVSSWTSEDERQGVESTLTIPKSSK